MDKKLLKRIEDIEALLLMTKTRSIISSTWLLRITKPKKAFAK